MKKFTDILIESKIKNENKIYLGNKEITPQRYIFDKESLDEFVEYLKKNELKDNEIKLCHLSNGKWNVLKYNCYIDIYRKYDKFLKHNTTEYSYNDIIDKFKDDYMIVIIKNNKNGRI